MRVLLTGANGQLSRHLLARLESVADVIVTSRQARQAQNLELDIADSEQIEQVLNQVQPDVVINAAAYTSVDGAESDHDAAYQINAHAPGVMANWVKRHQAVLLHYSTDYVFDGSSGQPYVEDDSCRPLNVYGASKLEGEQAILASGCNTLIFRSSWIYSAWGKNFFRTMLKLATERPELTVVDDQTGCPTWAGGLADMSLVALQQARDPGFDQWGIYHTAGDTALSWYQFAKAIVAQGIQQQRVPETVKVMPVSSTMFSQAAERPVYSVLNCEKFECTFDYQRADFNTELRASFRDLRNNNE